MPTFLPFSGGDGAEVIYALRNSSTLANKVLEEIAKEGQNIRKAYQRRLPSDTSKDYYFIHRDTGITQPIIVEYGFLDSTGDDVNQLKTRSQDYAEAVVRAVMEYLKLPYLPPAGTNTYVVKAGDSLWSIAKKYGITVEELKAANNLTTNVLKIGQVLKIPVATQPPVTGEYIVYTVVAGDSLYSIARKYDTTVDKLVEYNNLASTNLKIGQQILIPTTGTIEPTVPTVPTTNYVIYTVKAGDSLYGIAQKYNTTVTNLMDYNNLSSTLLSIGQQIKIPTSQPELPTEPSPEPYIEYVVKSGDNLYAIARKYDTTVDALMNYNNLKSNLLNVGQIIKIPSSSSTNTYVVKSGDNLYSIAQKYNTTVDEIKRKNNLTSNLLSIGQILII